MTLQKFMRWKDVLQTADPKHFQSVLFVSSANIRAVPSILASHRLIVIAAVSNRFDPSIGRMRCLIRR
jgi:hypothetical protein